LPSLGSAPDARALEREAPRFAGIVGAVQGCTPAVGVIAAFEFPEKPCLAMSVEHRAGPIDLANPSVADARQLLPHFLLFAAPDAASETGR
jgi:hypothetical protein